MLILLRAKAWNPILEGLQKGEATIRSSLEEAKHTRDQMAAMQAAMQKELAEASNRFRSSWRRPAKKGKPLPSRCTGRPADIAAERAGAFGTSSKSPGTRQSKNVGAPPRLASIIAAKVVGRSLSFDDHRRLLDEGLQEMRRVDRN